MKRSNPSSNIFNRLVNLFSKPPKTPDGEMEIKFESHGGFAGLHLEYQVKTSQLPSEIADELIALVDASGILDKGFQNQLGDSKSDIAPPDAIMYDLQVKRGDQEFKFHFNDAHAPPNINPLLSRLRRLAIEEKRHESSK